jgi:membrane protein
VKTVLHLFRDAFGEWQAVNAPRLGAALAFYTMFSLAPLLVIAVAIAGLVFGEEAARGEVGDQIEDATGPVAARSIQELLKHAWTAGEPGLAMLIGAGVLLFGASGVFVELREALNTIWGVRPQGQGLWWAVRNRFLSFALVLGGGFLLLLSLVINTALAALDKYLGPAGLPVNLSRWETLNTFVSLGVLTVLFALVFKFLPEARVAWRDIWVGAFVTAGLFTTGKYFIGLYLGKSSTASAFGAAGSLAVMLLWVYYSAQIFLFGAAFTHVYSRKLGSGAP